MTYQKEMNGYVEVEQMAHINNSASIVNKVTQEVLELKQGKRKNDSENVNEETRDAIVNILSATTKTGVFPEEALLQKDLVVTGDDVDDALSDWNEDVQGFNQDYSRRHVTPEMLKISTEKLLSVLLSYSGFEKTLSEILAHNTEKFRARIPKYRPNIDLKDHIVNYPGFPKPGIQFKDISPLLRSKEAMNFITNELLRKTYNADIIAGLDARGFLFGMSVAEGLHKPFVMIRKKGKLPGGPIEQSYEKEYGIDTIAVQKGAIQPGQKVAIIDDLLATGGTMNAAANLVEKVGGEVIGLFNIVQLDDAYCTSERKKLNLDRYKIDSMVHYND